MDAVGAFSLISLVAGAVGAVLAIVAIGVTIALFLASHRTSLQMLKFLSEIQTSTHATERTTSEQMSAMLERLLGLVSERTQSSVAEEKAHIVGRVDSILSEELADDEALKKRIQGKMEDAISSGLRSLAYDVASLPAGAVADRTPHDTYPPALVRVMEWIRKNERDYAFLGVKFMRDRIFKNDAAARAALQFGIDVGMLELYKVENPENPDWKTTACRLDRGHSIVQALLADAEIGNER